MTEDKIEAVARRVVELLAAERQRAVKAAVLAELDNTEAAIDALEISVIRLRRTVEAAPDRITGPGPR